MNTTYSPKKIITLAMVAIILIGLAVFVVRPWLQNRTVSTVVQEKIERPAVHLEFTFPGGAEAYSFIEPQFNGTATPGAPEAAFIMIDTDEYQAYEQKTSNGETPPTMSILVFPEPAENIAATATTGESVDRMTRLRNWAEANTVLTAYTNAKKAPEEVEIDGVKLLHYQADGLYPQDIYIALHRGKFYLFVGQYDGEGDARYTDFQNLMATVSFL